MSQEGGRGGGEGGVGGWDSQQWTSVCINLLTGLSVSSSLRMDLPSISAGMSIPAMSSSVGARSMLSTM